MTIDYKALAEKLNALSERLVDSEEHAVEAAIPPIAEEAAEALCTVVSLLDGMADAPAMWVQSNHLSWAGKQPFMARCAPTQLNPDFVPVYLHPAPQPQPIDTGFTLDQLADACMWAEIPDSKYESLCIALAEKRKTAPQPQPEPTEAHDLITYGTAVTRGGERVDPKSIYQDEPTEAQIEATAKWLNENLPALVPAYFSRRALATGALRAALAARETK